jgi:hypothetical protein
MITWNDSECGLDGNILGDLEFEWDNDLKVYMSQNEAADDFATWIRILSIC